MTASVVVSYSIKPEATDEHVRLIQAIFEQLAALELTTVDYQVLRLQDGVSFVHVSTAHTADGSNPLPELSSFVEFAKNLGSRVATPPKPTPATIIGSYTARPTASAHGR